jgi:predicted RNase H-like HicB family nuclease
MSNALKDFRKCKALARPFDARILARAKKIAQQYQIVVSFEDGEYYGRGVELPGTGDDGKTPAECLTKTRRALVATVAYLLESGQTPPAPAHEGTRDQQLNIRLSSQEKLLLETRARQSGATGISEYVRSVALRG